MVCMCEWSHSIILPWKLIERPHFLGVKWGFMYLFFSFFLDTLSFVHRSCDHIVIANIVLIFDIYIWGIRRNRFRIYIYMKILLSFFTYLSMCCFFSPFIHMFFKYAIFYFCFTLRCLNEFCLKCFRNTGCQNLSCDELSSCKVFQEFVLGLDFIVFNKWLRVEGFMTSFIFHLFVVVLPWISKGGNC